jgi:DNA polymerase-3 subunit alpha
MPGRAGLMAQAEDALKLAQKAESDRAQGQGGLFGGAASPQALQPPRGPVAEWDQKETLRYEKEALGFYITGHPLDKHDRELRRLRAVSTSDLSSRPDSSQVLVAGVVQAIKLKNNKAGKRYATFSLEDREGAVEVIAWPETYQKHEALLMGDEPVVARGKLDVDDERAQIILDELRLLGSALVEAVREVHITAPRDRFENGAVEELKALLGSHSGRAITYLHLGLDESHEAVFLLGEDYRVAPTEDFVSAVERMLAPAAVTLR